MRALHILIKILSICGALAVVAGAVIFALITNTNRLEYVPYPIVCICVGVVMEIVAAILRSVAKGSTLLPNILPKRRRRKSASGRDRTTPRSPSFRPFRRASERSRPRARASKRARATNSARTAEQNACRRINSVRSAGTSTNNAPGKRSLRDRVKRRASAQAARRLSGIKREDAKGNKRGSEA